MRTAPSNRFHRNNRFHRFLPMCFALLLSLLLAACHRATPPASAPTAAPLLSDEPARIAATLSTNTIRIGDPIDLTLTALHRPGTRIEFPPLEHGKDVIVRSPGAPETLPADGDLERTTRHYTLTSLVVSNHIVAENAPVLIHLPDGSTSTQSMPFASFEEIGRASCRERVYDHV